MRVGDIAVATAKLSFGILAGLFMVALALASAFMFLLVTWIVLCT